LQLLLATPLVLLLFAAVAPVDELEDVLLLLLLFKLSGVAPPGAGVLEAPKGGVSIAFRGEGEDALPFATDAAPGLVVPASWRRR